MGKNRVTIKNDINIEKDSSPFGRFKSIGSTIGGWGKKAYNRKYYQKWSSEKIQPMVDLANRQQNGEKIKVSEVFGAMGKTGLNVGATIATGGTSDLSGKALDGSHWKLE